MLETSEVLKPMSAEHGLIKSPPAFQVANILHQIIFIRWILKEKAPSAKEDCLIFFSSKMEFHLDQYPESLFTVLSWMLPWTKLPKHLTLLFYLIKLLFLCALGSYIDVCLSHPCHHLGPVCFSL